MKPMTEEQRQSLISACKEEISRLKELAEQHEFLGNDYSLEETNNAILRQQIALSSLTADSVRQFIYNNPYEEGYIEWVDCNEEYFNGVPNDCRRVVYTAPPVPVINDNRVVSPHFDDIALETARDIMHDVNRRHEFLGGEVQLLSHIQCRINDALQRAVDETKRLNGLE